MRRIVARRPLLASLLRLRSTRLRPLRFVILRGLLAERRRLFPESGVANVKAPIWFHESVMVSCEALLSFEQ
jgi:hypothetical protein